MGEEGISSYELCQQANVTYRRLDYWTRQGYVTPSVSNETGGGTSRRWNATDVLIVKVLSEIIFSVGASSHDISAQLRDKRQEIEEAVGPAWVVLDNGKRIHIVSRKTQGFLIPPDSAGSVLAIRFK